LYALDPSLPKVMKSPEAVKYGILGKL